METLTQEQKEKMIFPPTYRDYEYGDKCEVDLDNPCICNKGFNCGACDIAWNEYKKEIENDLDDIYKYIVPDIEWSERGVFTLKNKLCTIVKADNVENLYKRFDIKGVFFKPIEKEDMDTDDMKYLYPLWYALEVIGGLGDPLSYKGGKDIPLIVEYSDCVYMVAPTVGLV